MHTFRQSMAVITGIAYYLPEQSVPSRMIEEQVQASSGGFVLPRGLIERLSGVAHRYHLAEGSSSDLAVEAGRRALQRANLEPSQIDMLIFAAASHDVAEPATANVVQEKLGCTRAHVFDVKNACNSFLNALDVAHAFIQTRRASRVLIATGEMLSPTINMQINNLDDLNLKFAGLTLGDAGAACVVEGVSAAADAAPRGVLPGRFYSDGSQWRLSTIMSGGTLLKHDTSRMYFECQPAPLQDLALEWVPRLIEQTLTELEWNLQRDVALVVAHQVSKRLTRRLCAATGYPLERCMVTLDQVGNTAAASIPIALSMAVEAGRVQRGDRILLVGGAAGFSAGVVPLIW
ncbi:MAG: ketoacyl-ACP synthase III [Chloroflexaceae bacterium]|nr:ketoacyl-ACP synthase III [Chloroflexaceae bacterium]